jgi:hypothetical protein
MLGMARHSLEELLSDNPAEHGSRNEYKLHPAALSFPDHSLHSASQAPMSDKSKHPEVFSGDLPPLPNNQDNYTELMHNDAVKKSERNETKCDRDMRIEAEASMRNTLDFQNEEKAEDDTVRSATQILIAGPEQHPAGGQSNRCALPRGQVSSPSLCCWRSPNC